MATARYQHQDSNPNTTPAPVTSAKQAVPTAKPVSVLKSKKRPALNHRTLNSRRPTASSLAKQQSSKIAPCSTKIVRIQKANVNLSGATPISSAKQSIAATNKTTSFPKTDAVLCKSTSMDISLDQSDAFSVSMDESMLTCDSLKSPEVEYIDNNETAAIESIEREVSSMLCISDDMKFSGTICKRGILGAMETDEKIVDVDDDLDDPIWKTNPLYVCGHKDRYLQDETEKKAMSEKIERLELDFESRDKQVLELQELYNSQQQLTSELTDKLQKTEEKLQEIEHSLLDLEERHRQENAIIKEKEYLIFNLLKSEKALVERAHELRAELGNAASDVSSMFTKIERKDKIEDSNRALIQKFHSQFSQKPEILHKALVASTTQQKQQPKVMEEDMHSFVSTKTEATKELQIRFEKLKTMYGSGLKAFDDLAGELDSNSQSTFVRLNSEVSKTSSSLEELLKGITSEADTLLRSLQDSQENKLSAYAQQREILELDNCSLFTSVYLDLHRLQNIRLVHCLIFVDLNLRSNVVSSITVSNCPSLQRISITSNALKKLLQKHVSLTTLALQCPELGLLVLDSCESLTVVSVYSTSLVSLSLGGCLAITSLELQCPYLEHVSLDGCHHLEEASFSPFGLRSLDLGIFPKLSVLHIEAPLMVSLELKGCSVLSNAFIDCPLLTSLDASFCSQLKDDFLLATTASRPLIKPLVLISCPSVSVGPNGLSPLRDLPNLTHLDLSYTFLVNLQPVSDCDLYLKALKLQACKYLSNASLEPLYKGGALPALCELDLSCWTLCQSALEDLLAGCIHLTHVSLNGCVNMHDLGWSSRCENLSDMSTSGSLDSSSLENVLLPKGQSNRMLQNLYGVGCPHIKKVVIPPTAKKKNRETRSGRKLSFVKMFWAVQNKADTLWVKWLHEFYIKGRDLAGLVAPLQSSVLFKKLLKCRDLMYGQAQWDTMCDKREFDKYVVYSILRPPILGVTWKELVLNNRATPRARFCTWMAAWVRLATKDRLLKFHIVVDPVCVFCHMVDESHDHPVYTADLGDDVILVWAFCCDS